MIITASIQYTTWIREMSWSPDLHGGIYALLQYVWHTCTKLASSIA